MNIRKYFVIGLAKTGTTVVSKTIQNTMSINDYYMEPKDASFFEAISTRENDCVVKVLYDHWVDRPNLFNSIVYNEFNTNFLANIFIVRDPRAEIISRLHYVAYPYFENRASSESDVQKWLEIFRRKESDPGAVSLRDITHHLATNFNVFGAEEIKQSSTAAIRYAEYLSNLPKELKTVLRYEDFVSGNLTDHPLRDLLVGSRDVGDDLRRTRRSGGEDDWHAFFHPSDYEWLREILGNTAQLLGYDFAPTGPKHAINPENSSQYVEQIIREAQRKRLSNAK
ncbi:MAG: hypothetical protein E5X34_08595 [Mesorhizobium sp.]|uniref:hypothetical protein n=1 Tax=Mesorhizobium sp. TaxID=1871066 RepID=UPI00121724BF|nr:hypothetical protein [Mesorhizobium sp.]TIR25667.1 MAG: hypothetical protein E5X34_08595 [Mesorhizobium sp.]